MKIKNIKKIPKQETYDLSIEDNHNYFISEKGILVHNSSKDYTKVDRSGLYAARYIAKHIVSAGLSTKCTVQISYAIGIARPTSVSVDTCGTYTEYDDNILSSFVMDNFPLTPDWITNKFGLDKPSKDTFLYADVAARGQVGQPDYPWEQLNDLEIFENFKNL